MEIRYNPDNKRFKYEVWCNGKKIKAFHYEMEAERFIYIETKGDKNVTKA